ncbi:MAG: hypothetical protein WD187_01365 [Candidatus Woykebacteria bacterium]
MHKRVIFVLATFLIWFLASISLIIGAGTFYNRLKQIDGMDFLIASSSRDIFTAPENISGDIGDVLSAIQSQDARPVLVDRFLSKHNSPMAGLGLKFVEAADINSLDWRLLPALAFQESNLGKKIPEGSHNPFGWAIYPGKSSGASFDSWEKAIELVAIRMKENYIDQGLTTPETIVARYTSSGSPTWVFAIRSAMEEISENAY